MFEFLRASHSHSITALIHCLARPNALFFPTVASTQPAIEPLAAGKFWRKREHWYEAVHLWLLLIKCKEPCVLFYNNMRYDLKVLHSVKGVPTGSYSGVCLVSF